MKTLISTIAVMLMIFFTISEAATNKILFNGGISLDERESAPLTGTKLEFVVSSGSFLSDINVSVTDSAGKEVVNAKTKGPWLVLDLDPGNYIVYAQRDNDDGQGGVITVAGKSEESEKFTFMFPE